MGKSYLVAVAGLLIAVCTALRGTSALAVEKRPIPDPAKQQETLALVKKELFKKEYDAATTAAKRQELAQTLLKQSADSKKDPVGYYVLLQEASDVAVSAGDATLAMQAIDELSQNYAVNALSLKFKALETLSKGTLQAPQAKALAETGLTLVGDAVALDNFTGAKALGDLALAAARKSNDRDLIKTVTARVKEIDDDRAAFDKIKEAREMLTSTPDDPAANLAVGKYYCFVKDDWDQGLKLLARCDTPPLRAAARADLTAPTTADEQAKVGDLWWDAASAEKLDAKVRIQTHAARWYEEAFPSLTGLTREKIDRRLGESARLPKGAIVVFAFDKDDYIRKNGHVYVKDLSGRGNVGELMGNCVYAPQAKLGGGVVLDGKNSYITVPYSTSLNWEQYTFSMWIKFNGRPGEKIAGGQMLFTKKDHSHIWVDTFGWMKVEAMSPTERRWRGLTDDGGPQWKPENDKWIHMVGRYDGKAAEFFADGKSVSKTTRAFNDLPKPNNEPLNIGPEEWTFSKFLNGTIDEMAMFNRALSDSEILTLYRLGQYGKGLR